MAVDLERALDALDLAVAHAATFVDDQAIEPFAQKAVWARRRLGFLGETVVVALAGGTGVGKSSLLNAVAGEPVAPVGTMRPTTSTPLAWIPATPEPGLVRLLDELDVESRVGHEHDSALAILDLPDFDSLEEDHRARVEALLPRVDAVVWVVDPEKYNDRMLHGDYLRPLAGYQEQFLFVLNQIDRLTPDDVPVVVDDFAESLRSDGIDEPQIVAVAAAPFGEPPFGVEELTGRFAERFRAKQTAIGKLLADIRQLGRELADLTGVEPGVGVGFDEQWTRARTDATRSLIELVAGPETVRAAEHAGSMTARRHASGPIGRAVAGLRRSAVARAVGVEQESRIVDEHARHWAERPGLDAAVGSLSAAITDLSFAAGGSFGAGIRQSFGGERVEREVRGSVEAALAAEPPAIVPEPKRWWTAVSAIQWILAAVVLAAVVWGWASPDLLRRGSWPWPVVVGLAAAAVALGLARFAAWSGRRAGLAAVVEYRERFGRVLAEAIDRRLGRELRSKFRERAELGGALAELAIETEQARTRQAGSA